MPYTSAVASLLNIAVLGAAVRTTFEFFPKAYSKTKSKAKQIKWF